MYLPAQVIRHLYKYLETGVDLEAVDDELNGQKLVRYIANGKIIIWTEPKENNHA